MVRTLYLLFGLLAYAVFFATFLYLVAFVGDLPYVALTVDTGPSGNTTIAVVVDLALIAIFGVQHSVMARPGFKAVWTRIVPAPIERSIYLLFASAALILLYIVWRPIPAVIWDVSGSWVAGLMWAAFALGFAVVLISTFLLGHFELFGLKQVYLNLKNRHIAAPKLAQPLFYRFVRHPLYSGFLIAFWATPRMTAGHLLFAAAMTIYVLIAIHFEERDLISHFGAEYETYRQRVGMLTPKIGR